MGIKMKSSSETFNKHSADLINALSGYRHFNSEMKKNFEKLGYTIVTSSNHVKCYYNGQFVTTIASTPSDLNAGRQTLRYIRAFWENNDSKKELSIE